jgi:hypothetical protein
MNFFRSRIVRLFKWREYSLWLWLQWVPGIQVVRGNAYVYLTIGRRWVTISKAPR